MDETVKELLKDVRVASPCAENWSAMSGSDAVRSCERCQHKVYNLSEMTAPEAADLLRKAEGRLCVRFYRRADGTVMTKDCPVGAQAVRQRQRRRFGMVGLSMASVAGLVGVNLHEKATTCDVTATMVSDQPVEVVGTMSPPTPEATPSPAATPEPQAEMGEATLPVREPQATMGYMFIEPVRVGKPVRVSEQSEDKPFLTGLPARQDTPAREDPFQKVKGDDR